MAGPSSRPDEACAATIEVRSHKHPGKRGHVPEEAAAAALPDVDEQDLTNDEACDAGVEEPVEEDIVAPVNQPRQQRPRCL